MNFLSTIVFLAVTFNVATAELFKCYNPHAQALCHVESGECRLPSLSMEQHMHRNFSIASFCTNPDQPDHTSRNNPDEPEPILARNDDPNKKLFYVVASPRGVTSKYAEFECLAGTHKCCPPNSVPSILAPVSTSDKSQGTVPKGSRSSLPRSPKSHVQNSVQQQNKYGINMK
ncbi:hypothetical protein PTTG_26551 [Puccinia triticina 1-1 BBBD Race 1]|uniref:Uncharacterized protein n=2 Tax=Puccinia triticina TaxID=208348 RepID=A0A180GSY6_PUCT1|nr:uncharacterized protein PtA15_14A132 [Puccinia triticina]OAV95671.1 hypothetical protein PTTG_26551 [Puccinia triticina 1-1 BBBD Race 1]WAQ91250.1 hypothetical protein PtA15_14A132 [Puccinia triticina]